MTAALVSLGLLCGPTEAQDSPYRWHITPPHGPSYSMEGQGIDDLVLNMAGVWQFDLEVQYRHENPPKQKWVATNTVFMTVTSALIFADGFETGTTSAWATTIGESHD